jgi:hypothetical protein
MNLIRKTYRLRRGEGGGPEPVCQPLPTKVWPMGSWNHPSLLQAPGNELRLPPPDAHPVGIQAQTFQAIPGWVRFA